MQSIGGKNGRVLVAWGGLGGSASGSECPGTEARPSGRWGQGRRWHRGKGRKMFWKGWVWWWDGVSRAALPCDDDWGVFGRGGPSFYQGKRGRNPGGVHFLPPFEGRQRIEGSGYTKFGSGMPVQMRCKTRLVGTQNGGRTFVNAATNSKNVKRGRFDPVHHLLFGSSQRPRRSRILWVVFKDLL